MPEDIKRGQFREIYERLKEVVHSGQMKAEDIPLRDIYFGDDKELRFQNALTRGSHIRRKYSLVTSQKTVLDIIENPKIVNNIRGFGNKGRELLKGLLKNDFNLDLPTEAPKRSSLEKYNILMEKGLYREAGKLAGEEGYPFRASDAYRSEIARLDEKISNR